MKNNWPVKKLGELCTLATGGTPSREHSEYFGGNIKWLVSGDINRKEIYDCEERITELGLRKSNARILPKDCVLIALNGQGKTRGTVAILRTEAACNQSLVAMIPCDALLSEYLYHNLNWRYQEIRNLTGATDRRGLSMKIIREIEIPVPPIEEQKRIVKKLEKILAKIEESHILRQKSIGETNLIILKKLEEIFSQYSKYNVRKVQDIAKVGTGATPLRGKSDYYGGTIPWITSGSTNKSYITKADEYITELALKATNCKINKKHTLVVAMYGEGKTRGQVSELLIDAATNQACATISVNRDIANQRFIKYFFELNYKKTRELSRGGPQPNLNLTRIKNIELPVPNLKEQEKIVKYLDGLSEKVQVLQKLQQEQLRDLEALKQSVLHKSFQGEL